MSNLLLETPIALLTDKVASQGTMAMNASASKSAALIPLLYTVH